MIARADANTKALANWVAKTHWVDFLAKDATIRSNTSVCLEVVDPAITELAPDAQASFAKSLASLLEKEKVAYDVGAYRDAPLGLRIWCGATRLGSILPTQQRRPISPKDDFLQKASLSPHRGNDHGYNALSVEGRTR